MFNSAYSKYLLYCMNYVNDTGFCHRSKNQDIIPYVLLSPNYLLLKLPFCVIITSAVALLAFFCVFLGVVVGSFSIKTQFSFVPIFFLERLRYLGLF
ncbi:hypothetical protein FKM82_006172 [Ascaphus truei]